MPSEKAIELMREIIGVTCITTEKFNRGAELIDKAILKETTDSELSDLRRELIPEMTESLRRAIAEREVLRAGNKLLQKELSEKRVHDSIQNEIDRCGITGGRGGAQSVILPITGEAGSVEIFAPHALSDGRLANLPLAGGEISINGELRP